MTGGEAYRAKPISGDALDAATAAYLADPSAPAVLETEGGLNIAAAVLAHQWSADELPVEDAIPARRRKAVRTAILLAPACPGRPIDGRGQAKPRAGKN